MMSEFRKWLKQQVAALDFDKVFDFMPAEMRWDTALVIGDIVDKGSADHGLDLIFTRSVTVWSLCKIKDNKRAEAEERAEELSRDVLDTLGESTYSWNIITRKSIGYTIGQFTFQAIEMSLEFYDVED